MKRTQRGIESVRGLDPVTQLLLEIRLGFADDHDEDMPVDEVHPVVPVMDQLAEKVIQPLAVVMGEPVAEFDDMFALHQDIDRRIGGGGERQRPYARQKPRQMRQQMAQLPVVAYALGGRHPRAQNRLEVLRGGFRASAKIADRVHLESGVTGATCGVAIRLWLAVIERGS